VVQHYKIVIQDGGGRRVGFLHKQQLLSRRLMLMNEILQQGRRLPPETDHLTKMDKNDKFKMTAAAILDFCTNSNNSAAD